MGTRPKGITVLFWLCLVIALVGLADVLQSDQSVLILGRPVGGLVLKFYNTAVLTLFVIVLLGLFQLRRWGYNAFLLMNAVGAAMIVANAFLASEAALAEVGITQANIFYGFAVFHLFTVFILSAWVFAYRTHFGSDRSGR